jgi:hypothetical protein
VQFPACAGIGFSRKQISSPTQVGACPVKALPFRAGKTFYTVFEHD